MKWRHKAIVQNLLAGLPPGIGNQVYYYLQSRYGGLRTPTPVSRLIGGVEIARRIHRRGQSVESKVFVEVGTGHQLNLPLSLWLCGAAQIITVDLNPYLKPELVMNDLEYLRAHQAQVHELYAGLPASRFLDRRLAQVLACASLEELMATTCTRYMAPADASRLALAPASVDYHVSFTVLEHIPPSGLRGIFQEARRLLRPDGLLVHYIDFTDHFAHSDPTISSVNFLQFSDREWERLAGNRFMFHNRLRVDEFRTLLLALGLEILELETRVDERALAEMRNGFALDKRFQMKDFNTNAAGDAWLVASIGE